jgi:hypothetical protein
MPEDRFEKLQLAVAYFEAAIKDYGLPEATITIKEQRNWIKTCHDTVIQEMTDLLPE